MTDSVISSSELSRSASSRMYATDRLPLLFGRLLRAIWPLADALVIVGLAILSGEIYSRIAFGQGCDIAAYMQLGIAVAVLRLALLNLRIHGTGEHAGSLRSELRLWTLTFLAVIALGFFLSWSADYDRGAIILFFVLGFPLLAFWQRAWKQFVKKGYRSGALAAHRVLLLGTSDKIQEFERRYRSSDTGLIIGGTVEWHDEALTETAAGAVLLREGVRRAVETLRTSDVDEVVVLLPWSNSRAIHTCADMLRTTPARVRLGPEAMLDRYFTAPVSRIGAAATIDIVRPPLSWVEVWTKRVVDLVCAFAIILVTLPLLLLLSVFVKLDSPGPVLFRQRRRGFNQREFTIYKFRTMTVAEDDNDVEQASKNDPRVTNVGRFLRRWNLDELPQLLNVLRGEMSLVGPRPHAVMHDRDFELRVASYARRHNIKPGITGWAQVNGWRGPTDTDGKVQNRVDCDLFYVDNWSLTFDICIIFMTLFSPNAYRNAH